MNSWHFKIRDVSLEQALPWALDAAKADKLLFTMRLSQGKGESRAKPAGVEGNVREIFGRYIESFWASGWPGTQLCEHKGRVWVTDFDGKVLAAVVRRQPDFSKWLNREPFALPEDLCAFREGEKYPALVSVTHEGDAWLVSDQKPNLPSVGKKEGLEGFIFAGRYFCRE